MGIFDRLREGVDKASFEANKIMRINKVQGRINDLNRQVEQQMVRIGEHLFERYQEGQVSDEELTGFCRQIEELQQRIEEHNAELDRIRQEKPPDASPLDPSRPRATYGHICPNCQVALDESLSFCTQCGTRAVDAPPPTPETEAEQASEVPEAS